MIDVSAQGGREPRHVPERAGDAWNRMVTVVPCAGALVRPMVPPQLSTSRRAMASPRPDPAFSPTSGGSGLGLAIARRLVESWGGTIGLTSVQGRGTTVTIRFRGSPSRPGT